MNIDHLTGFTPGPYRYSCGLVTTDPVGTLSNENEICDLVNNRRSPGEIAHTGLLLAAAPDLLTEIKRLQSDNDRLRQALVDICHKAKKYLDLYPSPSYRIIIEMCEVEL